MPRGKANQERKLIPFQVIHFRVPRRYLLKRYEACDLTIVERSKILKIKHRMEEIINMANHVVKIIDSTTRRANQKEV
jgi:hypothetical protein